MKDPRSLATHDGPFHADEVTATALLLTCGLIDRDKIRRTRDLALIARCEYVCDVGGLYDPSQKLFDHHQVDYTGPLSSAGMVLQYIRDQGLLSKEECRLLHDNLIKGVDDHDNGRGVQELGVCTFSHVIANMIPIAYDAPDEAYEEAFYEAVDFVQGHLTRLLERHRLIASYREEVRAAMEGATDALIFDKRLPWQENFFALGGEEHPARFVIMPAGNHWKLRGIPQFAQKDGSALATSRRMGGSSR